MVECVGSLHVLQIMWMAHPNQADRPQGTHRVSDGLLVANDLGKAQAGNRAGKTLGTTCSGGTLSQNEMQLPLGCTEDTPLHPFFTRGKAKT